MGRNYVMENKVVNVLTIIEIALLAARFSTPGIMATKVGLVMSIILVLNSSALIIFGIRELFRRKRNS